MITERIEAFWGLLKKENIDYYIVPTDDDHGSEYVGNYYKAREYLSGFTGSAGTLVVGPSFAGLWTDGRYFLQAQEELAGTPIQLFKSGMPDVPTFESFIVERIKEGGTLAFDGRMLGSALGKKLETLLSDKHVHIRYQLDLAGELWKDRPKRSEKKAWFLENQYAGKEAADKIFDLRAYMLQKGTDTCLIADLADIGWLLNIRGNDILCNPLVLAFFVLRKNSGVLYMDSKKLHDSMEQTLKSMKIDIKNYEDIYTDVSKETFARHLLLDERTVNYRLYKNLNSKIRLLPEAAYHWISKAVKNPVEIRNLKDIHRYDGAAVTKFIYWLKNNVGKIPMTELSAAKYLEEQRRQIKGYIEPSFTTISGYQAHGAIVHYAATPKTDAALEPYGFLLVDSGGQYKTGTTDITRTIALGELSDSMRYHFTLVLKSMLALGNVRFLYGCSGQNLDIIAREPLWQAALDYRHGTGHGVGYLSGVHEEPNSFRWKPSAQCDWIFEEGMVTSDEPGLYIEGEYGIRTENEILCVKDHANDYGQFMTFEYLTLVPIDLDAIDPSLLDERETAWLNNYHQKVYEEISPYLTYEESAWLKQYTRPL